MNRQQQRAEARELSRKTGVSRNTAEAYIMLREMGEDNPFTPRKFKEDEKVMLDIDRIKGHEHYEEMSEMYKKFVETHADSIFTAHTEPNSLISLRENPEWLFWPGDLKSAENKNEEDEMAYISTPQEFIGITEEDKKMYESSVTTTASI